LFLIGFRGFKIQGVVHSYGHLGSNPAHKLDFGFADALGDKPPEYHRAQAVMSGSEWKNRRGVHANGLQFFHEVRVARIFSSVLGEEEFLIFENPAGGRVGDRHLFGAFRREGIFRFQNVQAHGAARRIVKNQAEKIELQHRVETIGKFVEEKLQVALLGDRFADFEQGFKLAHGLRQGRSRGGRGRRVGKLRHKHENSIGFRRLTTEGRVCENAAVFVYSRGCLAAKGDGFVMGTTLKLRFVVLICSLAVLFAVSGCGSGRSPEDRQEDRRPKVRADFPTSSSGYDLGRDEQRGGHTLARHVARTDDELRERLQRERNISAASTWTDRATAEAVVGDALTAERGRVESWTRRGFPRANLALHYNAGRMIGRSLRRGDMQTVPCSSAVIVLRADGPENFYVLTTYPEARE
jgi:hypothetical protein